MLKEWRYPYANHWEKIAVVWGASHRLINDGDNLEVARGNARVKALEQVAEGRTVFSVNRLEMSFTCVPSRTTFKVPPRLELGLLDSESRVLTITPWNPQMLAMFVSLPSASCVAKEKLVGQQPMRVTEFQRQGLTRNVLVF